MFEFNLDDLFNSVENPLDWDKDSYKFNREEKDMHPYSTLEKDNDYIIIHNVLGIDKKDIALTLKNEQGNYYIFIDGATTDAISGKKYSVHSKFAVDPIQLELDKITSKINNGLLYIIIKKKNIKTLDRTIKIEVL